MKIQLFRLTVALVLCALTGSVPCRASEPVVVPDSAENLAEVQVTALKQLSALRSQPEAATLLTGAELERINAHSIKGISDAVPNFFMPDYGSRITSSIYVRGIGARMDQPSVGLNVDNVPFLNKDAYDFDIADIASVEMLRGPQSTMYGRNTMTGVINITTMSPMRYQGFRFMLQGSSRRRTKASAGWYHKFNDRTGLSVTGWGATDPGEFRNLYNGKRTDWERSLGLRAKLHWRPSADWTLQNSASATVLRQGGYPYEWKDTGEISYNDTCFYRRFTFADGLTARWSGERVSVTSITSVQHIDDNMTLDQDFLPLDYFTITQKKKETALTEDIIVRPASSEGQYKWLAGVFGFYKRLDMKAPVTFKDKGISELIEKHRNEANPNYPIEWVSRSFPLNSDFTMPTWGASLYHESEYTAGRWNFSAALRLDYEHASLDYRSHCDTGYDIYRITSDGREWYRRGEIKIDETGHLTRHNLTVLPRLTVEYELPETGNVYFKFSRGYKAGGFNTQMFSDVLQQRLMTLMGIGAQYDVDDIVGYKPEKSWNYELGTHLMTHDGKLTADAAAFLIDCRDQQLTMFPDGTTTGRIMTNAGRTLSAGCELSVSYSPSPQWCFNASYGYTHARFRKFHNGIRDFKGKALPYAPSSTLFLQGVWQKRVGDAEISADVNLRGTGPIYWNEENTERQPFYVLLGANVSVDFDKGFGVSLWGRNLTATHYRTFYFVSMGNAFYQRGRGPEAGVTFRLEIKS